MLERTLRENERVDTKISPGLPNKTIYFGMRGIDIDIAEGNHKEEILFTGFAVQQCSSAAV